MPIASPSRSASLFPDYLVPPLIDLSGSAETIAVRIGFSASTVSGTKGVNPVLSPGHLRTYRKNGKILPIVF